MEFDSCGHEDESDDHESESDARRDAEYHRAGLSISKRRLVTTADEHGAGFELLDATETAHEKRAAKRRKVEERQAKIKKQANAAHALSRLAESDADKSEDEAELPASDLAALSVRGYGAQLFRDDAAAAHVDSGRHLVPIPQAGASELARPKRSLASLLPAGSSLAAKRACGTAVEPTTYTDTFFLGRSSTITRGAALTSADYEKASISNGSTPTASADNSAAAGTGQLLADRFDVRLVLGISGIAGLKSRANGQALQEAGTADPVTMRSKLQRERYRDLPGHELFEGHSSELGYYYRPSASVAEPADGARFEATSPADASDHGAAASSKPADAVASFPESEMRKESGTIQLLIPFAEHPIDHLPVPASFTLIQYRVIVATARRTVELPGLESALISRQAEDPRFTFLQPSNALHGLYQALKERALSHPDADWTEPDLPLSLSLSASASFAAITSISATSTSGHVLETMASACGWDSAEGGWDIVENYGAASDALSNTEVTSTTSNPKPAAVKGSISIAPIADRPAFSAPSSFAIADSSAGAEKKQRKEKPAGFGLVAYGSDNDDDGSSSISDSDSDNGSGPQSSSVPGSASATVATASAPSSAPVAQPAAAPVPPPSEQVEVIDKLCAYTARNGKAFLALVSERERYNPKFAFLLPWSPHAPYWQSRLGASIAEYEEKLRQEQLAAAKARALEAVQNVAAAAASQAKASTAGPLLSSPPAASSVAPRLPSPAAAAAATFSAPLLPSQRASDPPPPSAAAAAPVGPLLPSPPPQGVASATFFASAAGTVASATAASGSGAKGTRVEFITSWEAPSSTDVTSGGGTGKIRPGSASSSAASTAATAAAAAGDGDGESVAVAEEDGTGTDTGIDSDEEVDGAEGFTGRGRPHTRTKDA